MMRAGNLSTALVALGLKEGEARAAEARIREGAIVVGVQAAVERLPLAMQLLELSGGATLQAERDRPLTQAMAVVGAAAS